MCRKTGQYAAAQNSANAVQDGANLKNKRRRSRTAFTEWQLAGLERRFSEQQYMVGEERAALAESLQLNPSQVKIWFQNRRIRWRREHFANLRRTNTLTTPDTKVSIIDAAETTPSFTTATDGWNSRSLPENTKQQLHREVAKADKK